MSEKYKNTYCPICLWPTDSRGDHWQGCEYEAEGRDGRPLEPRPLSEIEMLIRRIEASKITLKNLNSQARNVKSEIAKDKDRMQHISC